MGIHFCQSFWGNRLRAWLLCEDTISYKEEAGWLSLSWEVGAEVSLYGCSHLPGAEQQQDKAASTSSCTLWVCIFPLNYLCKFKLSTLIFFKLQVTFLKVRSFIPQTFIMWYLSVNIDLDAKYLMKLNKTEKPNAWLGFHSS